MKDAKRDRMNEEFRAISGSRDSSRRRVFLRVLRLSLLDFGLESSQSTSRRRPN